MKHEERYKWLRPGDRLADLVSKYVQAGYGDVEEALALLENWRVERQKFAIECVGEAAGQDDDVIEALAEETSVHYNAWLSFRSWAADHWSGGVDPGDVDDETLRCAIDKRLKMTRSVTSDPVLDAIRAVLLVSEATRGRKDLSTWDYATGGGGADAHVAEIARLIGEPMPALVNLMYGPREGDDAG